MVYESNYRPTHTGYGDELCHYGVKGMRWGHRKATSVAGTSAQRQAYLNAKANKKAAGKAYSKAYNKAYNRSIAGLSPFKKHRQANDARWDDAVKKAKAMNTADKAYKDAKKAYKQTDEYKAKRAKALKVGAAVAGTALAAYGAYKVSKVLKDKAATKSYETGRAAMDRWMAAANKQSQAGNWAESYKLNRVAMEIGAKTDARTNKVRNSTIEAAKYLYSTRRR